MHAPEAIDRLRQARARGLAAIEAAATLEDLRSAEVVALGRKSPVAEVQRSLAAIDPADRPEVGRAVNRLFDELREA
ncbi:MAG TPA: hypothetical protein VE962_04180, partial [Actinomycetota bacterium]|nr:hypothetical protein [Actinomycetota bacterium]